MENWVKPEFLIHRSIQDQCAQVGDLTVVITEQHVLLPYCSHLRTLIECLQLKFQRMELKTEF